MISDYLKGYVRHNRSSVLTLAALTLVSCLLLGLVIGIAGNLVVDYRVQAEHRGQAADPTALQVAFGLVCTLSAASIILMLRNAFEITMGLHLRELGIMKSVGANASQLRRLLVSEACVVALPAALVGSLLGLILAVLLLQVFAVASASGRTVDYELQIGITAPMLIAALVLSLLTVLVSATAPARKLERVSVLEALEGEQEQGRRAPWWHRAYRLLGVEGVVAAGSLWSRRKSMRVATFSMTLAIMALVTLLNVEALSGLSTQRTYFERYRDVWDVRLTISFDGEATYDPALERELRGAQGVTSVSVGNDLERVPDPTKAYYNVRTATPEDADALSSELEERYAGQADVRIENRYDEIEKDARARRAIRAGIEAFAAVLACIGIADLFSDVLGRTVLRRREVARLLAAGMSRAQVRRVFTLESLLIVGRPFVFAILANVAVLVWASSVVDLSSYLSRAPVVPTLAFACAALLGVQVANLLGERAVFAGGPLSIDLE